MSSVKCQADHIPCSVHPVPQCQVSILLCFLRCSSRDTMSSVMCQPDLVSCSVHSVPQCQVDPQYLRAPPGGTESRWPEGRSNGGTVTLIINFCLIFSFYNSHSLCPETYG